MGGEHGQASVEWIALIALLALALAAAIAFVPLVEGRSLGDLLARKIACAVAGRCEREPAADALARAYGERDAALVRRFTPSLVYESGTYTLPVDYRRCRSHRCSDAPDRPIDVGASTRGRVPAAAFTHVVHARGQTFLQYWFYYPDSNSTWMGSHQAYDALPPAQVAAKVATGSARYPAFHRDDWEGYQVRVDAAGRASARATAHHGYTSCKEFQCANEWGPVTGWTRVSKGSHAGHIPLETQWTRGIARRHHGAPFRKVTGYRPLYPGRDLNERTTRAGELDLIPLETLSARDRGGYRFDGITPPWRKRVYSQPSSDSTS